MSATIYHNPRCSKSRGALEILKNHFPEEEIHEVRYLQNPPTANTLMQICSLLNLKPVEIIRSGEAIFKELSLNKNDQRSDEEWCEILASNPKLIERPIVVINNKAVIARPPEKVLQILD